MSFSDTDIQLLNRLKFSISNLRNLLDTFPNPDPHLLSIITYRQKENNTIVSILQQSGVFHTSTINQPSTPPPPTLYTTLSSSPTFNQATLPASQLLEPQLVPSLLLPALKPSLPVYPLTPQPLQQHQLLSAHLLPALQPHLQVRQPPDKPICPPRQPPTQPAQDLLLQPQLAPPTVLAAHPPIYQPATTRARQTAIQPTPPSPPYLLPFSSYLFPPDPKRAHLYLSLLQVQPHFSHWTPQAIKHFLTPSLLLGRCTAKLPANKGGFSFSTNTCAIPIFFPAIATAQSALPAVLAIITLRRAGLGGESNPALPKSNPSGRSGGECMLHALLHSSLPCDFVPHANSGTTQLLPSLPPSMHFGNLRHSPVPCLPLLARLRQFPLDPLPWFFAYIGGSRGFTFTFRSPTTPSGP